MSLSSGAARDLALRVVVPGYHGRTPPAWLADRLSDGLAGVCWFAQNVGPDVGASAAEIHSLHPGALVLSDEEGGEVTRLEPGGSRWPGAGTLGLLDEPATTRAVHHALGAEARAAGVDVVLGPVADVNSDPRNPVIGVRAFGGTTDLVSRHVEAAVTGLQDAGVAACAKHFPGHGATRTDSHLGLPVLDESIEVLRGRDLPPFAAAVGAGVRAVMTAHVVLSALEPDRPATLSRAALDLLRHDLGFEGVVISDALDMHAISRTLGRGPGAVAALGAGVDLLCIGNPAYPETYDDEAVCDQVVLAVADALVDGSLSVPRVEEAAGRVAELSAWVRASRPRDPTPVDPVAVATRSLRVEGDLAGVHAPLLVAVGDRLQVAAGRGTAAFVDGLVGHVADASAAALTDPDELPELLLGTAGRHVVAVVGSAPEPDVDHLLALLLDAVPDAVLLDVGPPGRLVAASRTIRTHGGGHAVAAAVAALIPAPEETS